VEPVSEEIKLSFDMSGRIRGVSVEEGDRIQAGQVVAELDNDDFRARVALAEAVLANRRAELDKTLAGARRQERREAGSRASEAEADMVQARREYERRERLKDMAVISREEADRSEREMLMAASRAEALKQRHSLVEDRAREEDIAMARAAVAEAAARLDEARALFEKTVIRSPIAATVLRKHRREGEIVSSAFDTPILTIGDVSRLRVRAEVDEADIARIRGGQRAYVVAEAFGPEKFWGSVGRVSRILGRKNVRTDRPDERVDTKVLETLIDMDTADRLVSGLRVDVYVIVEPGARPRRPGSARAQAWTHARDRSRPWGPGPCAAAICASGRSGASRGR
jgi:ABC exporter DevB family membrane fusion protein